MQFLRTIFWVVIAVLGVIFAFNNWNVVSVKLWAGVLVETPLPVLLLAVFLLGLLPTFILHRTTRWRLRKKLEVANRSLIETRTILDPATETSTIAPSNAPPLL